MEYESEVDWKCLKNIGYFTLDFISVEDVRCRPAENEFNLFIFCVGCSFKDFITCEEKRGAGAY